MGKVFLIVKNTSTTKNEKWVNQTNEWIQRFIDFNKEEGDDVIADYKTLKAKDKNKTIIIMGSDFQKDIVPIVENLTKKKFNCQVIENLCCDISVPSYIAAMDYLRFNGYVSHRDFKFLNEEIISFVKKTLEDISGDKSNFTHEEYMVNLKYDSLELVSLIVELEEKYNISLSPVCFAKKIQIKDIYKIFEENNISPLYL